MPSISARFWQILQKSVILTNFSNFYSISEILRQNFGFEPVWGTDEPAKSRISSPPFKKKPAKNSSTNSFWSLASYQSNTFINYRTEDSFSQRSGTVSFNFQLILQKKTKKNCTKPFQMNWSGFYGSVEFDCCYFVGSSEAKLTNWWQVEKGYPQLLYTCLHLNRRRFIWKFSFLLQVDKREKRIEEKPQQVIYVNILQIKYAKQT